MIAAAVTVSAVNGHAIHEPIEGTHINTNCARVENGIKGERDAGCGRQETAGAAGRDMPQPAGMYVCVCVSLLGVMSLSLL